MKTTLKTLIIAAMAALFVGCATETMTGADQGLKAQLNAQPFLVTGFTGDKSRMGIATGDRVENVFGSLLVFGQAWTIPQRDDASPKMTPLNWTVFDPAEEGCKYDAIGCMTIGTALFAFELRVPEDPQNGTLELRVYGGSRGGVQFNTAAALMSRIASGEYPRVGTFTGTIGTREIARHLLLQRPLRLTLIPSLVTGDDWLALLREKPDSYFENLDALLTMESDGDRNACLATGLPALAEASSKERARTYLAKATKDDSAIVRHAAILPYCDRIKPDARLLEDLRTLATNRDPDVRKRVVYVLSKHDVGIPILIQRLADRNKEVTELAFVRLDRIDRAFTDTEVAALGALATTSPRTAARLAALKLLAKVPAELSNVWIVPAMGDKDSDVREDALKVLKTRTFTEADLSAMQAIARHERRSVRRDVIPLANSLTADGATLLLIDLLADPHGDVRKAAYAALAGRSVGARHLQPLSVALNAAPSATRIFAAQLLGTVKDPRVAEILTKRLEREGHKGVRQAIILALNKQLSKGPAPTPEP